MFICSASVKLDDAIPLGYLMDASKATFIPHQSQKVLSHLIKGAMRFKGHFQSSVEWPMVNGSLKDGHWISTWVWDAELYVGFSLLMGTGCRIMHWLFLVDVSICSYDKMQHRLSCTMWQFPASVPCQYYSRAVLFSYESHGLFQLEENQQKGMTPA